MTSIKLSLRLQAIADMIPGDKILFDVGTDHAYLPCYLVSSKKTAKAYAGDLREKPLLQAKKTIEENDLVGKVIPILSDGLLQAPSDSEVVSISGMGYDNVEEILSSVDISKYERIIVQVNRRMVKVREYLNKKGYEIVDETVVEEGKHYYEILSFSPIPTNPFYNKAQLLLGPVNMVKKEETYLRYIKDSAKSLEEILSHAENKEARENLEIYKSEIQK